MTEEPKLVTKTREELEAEFQEAQDHYYECCDNTYCWALGRMDEIEFLLGESLRD